MQRVDLIHTGGDSSQSWNLGNSFRYSGTLKDLKLATSDVLSSTAADWLLFWDYSLGNVPLEIIKELATQPVDVFHAGLKVGTTGLPDVLNYVHPTWMYNIDGSADVSHSNFRLSLRACMIRTDVFRKIGLFSDDYATVIMSGVAFGYQVLKSGGIIRYHPGLLHGTPSSTHSIPVSDEWIFARQFFTKKWLVWTILNKDGFFQNLSGWIKTKRIKYLHLKPVIHSSVKTSLPVRPVTVSILAPTLDRYPYLKEELRELNEQTILPYEILITDQTDAEHRQTIDFTEYPNLSVRYFPQNEKGQCTAWNKLIEEAKGEYIFFFGDDAFDIKADLLEKMLQTMQHFNADMVASYVREKGISYAPVNHHYYMSDTFPITLIKKSVVVSAGGMDMFFNKNVKADHDLAMRCHLQGALMIYDSSAEIGHHRAPSGGLRTHNARVVTGFMTKNTINKVLNPTASEIFIFNKYYSKKQFLNHVKIKYMTQVIINGNILKKILRLFVLLYKLPFMSSGYKANYNIAIAELEKRGIISK